MKNNTITSKKTVNKRRKIVNTSKTKCVIVIGKNEYAVDDKMSIISKKTKA